MEMNIVNIGLSLVGLVIANYGAKFVKIAPLMKKAYKLTRDEVEARSDGIITQKEKAVLYDDIEGLVKEAYSIFKGLLPNRSKK